MPEKEENLRAMGKSTEPKASGIAKDWIGSQRDVSGKAGGAETALGLSQALWRRVPQGPLQPLVSSTAPSAAVQSNSMRTSALVQMQGSLERKSSALFPNLYKVPDPPPRWQVDFVWLIRSACLPLSSSRTTGVHHHAQL